MATRQKTSTSAFHEDHVVGKAFDPDLMGRLLRYALPYKGPMALAFLLILVVTAGGIAGPFLIMSAIDGPLQAAIVAPGAGQVDEGAWRELTVLTGAFVAIAATLLVLRFVQGVVMAWIGQRVMYDLRLELHEHLLRMPFAFFDRNPVGRLVTRLTSDIEALNELFASGIVGFIANLLVLVGIAVALIAVNPSLALITLGIVPLLLLTTFVFRAKARRFYRQQRGHLSHLNGFTQESVQGMGIVQAFHREKASQQEYERINGRYLHAFLRSVMAYSIYFPAIEVLSTVAVAAVVWQGGLQICSVPATLTFGEFFLFWHFVGRFFQPIREMAERYNVLQSAMAAAERVFQILDTPESLSDPATPRELAKLEGRIEFDHVWFAYESADGSPRADTAGRDAASDDSAPPLEFVLRDVSFVVEPGQTVAIVGATGAGKSTIINLMSRFYDPQRGAIRIDGVDVREYRKRELRRRISVVLQDVFLFSRTIRENILLGSSEISNDELRSCARHVNADRFIERLPADYDEVLAERGRTLSVGEKQLLVFARALIQDPDILVLDEATAHIDSETEALIQDALAKLLENRTSIVIAHRLSTIRRADKIIVLHKGEVREEGRHEDLVARGGIYQRLHELQYRDEA